MIAVEPVEDQGRQVSAHRLPRRRRALVGTVTLDPRRNGLNLVRLVFAFTVLVAHGWYLAGEGVGPHLDGENVGGWAVYGFFVVSGYLITGSRLSNTVGTYIVHRIARIFPAFIVCLVVTALVFAPINYVWIHGTIDGFLTTGTTPLNYIFANSTLRMNAYDVAGTPAGVAYAGAWDGSLWSLYYEFWCYVIVGALVSLRVFRRSPVAMGLTLALSMLLHTKIALLGAYVGNNIDFIFLAKLLPFFLAGAFLKTLGKRVVLTTPLAVLSIVATLAMVLLMPGIGAWLASPLIAYAVLWLGAVLPCPGTIRKNDISYGVYIYAFPVQQLLAMAGAPRLGLAVFDVVAAIATVPLAMASWLLIERPIMRLARSATTVRAAAGTNPAPVPG
jgi:peptidoglycan/LPS O-acetylase OafA/YrhL